MIRYPVEFNGGPVGERASAEKKKEKKNTSRLPSSPFRRPPHSFNGRHKREKTATRISLAGIPPFITGAPRKLNTPDEWGSEGSLGDLGGDIIITCDGMEERK